MADRKSWTRWVLLTEDGDLCENLFDSNDTAAMYAEPGDRIVRVTITVDEKKRRKGKRG